MRDNEMKAQTGLEFLLIFVFVLLLFGIAVFIYYTNVSQASAMGQQLQANNVCLSLASKIDSVASYGGTSTYVLNLANQIGNVNYTIWVASNTSTISVSYNSGVAGCRFSRVNITKNGGSSFFQMNYNSTLRSFDGGIVVD
jgi:hypothetical protein